MNRQFLIAALILSAVILIGSLGPFEFRQDFGSSLWRQIPLFGGLHITPHRLIHFAAFCALGTLVALISSGGYRLLLFISAVIFLGVFIETVQYLFSTNQFESWDIQDDTFATFFGVFCAVTLRAFARSLRSEYSK